jgi:hypothetical protein
MNDTIEKAGKIKKPVAWFYVLAYAAISALKLPFMAAAVIHYSYNLLYPGYNLA